MRKKQNEKYSTITWEELKKELNNTPEQNAAIPHIIPIISLLPTYLPHVFPVNIFFSFFGYPKLINTCPNHHLIRIRHQPAYSLNCSVRQPDYRITP